MHLTATGRFRRLIDGLSGEIIFPGERLYDEARRVHNGAISKYPAVIVKCANRTDVIRSIEVARESGLELSIRAGSHSFAGHGVCDGGMVLDLSSMKRIAMDPARRLVRVEPGVLTGELDSLTQSLKLAVPMGTCPSVGVTGYALAGGEGSLTPRFGYACDNLTRAEVITADGRALTASAEHNQDLFWAVRGAGANFGVATLLEFNLHRVDKVLSGHLEYTLHQGENVLHLLDSYAPEVPDSMFMFASAIRRAGKPLLDLRLLTPLDPNEGDGFMRQLLTVATPRHNTISIRDYFAEQREGLKTPPHGSSSRRRGGHLNRLPAEAIDVILAYAETAPTDASGITMMYWHGPWSSGVRDDAFGFRRPGFEYWTHCYWDDLDQRGPAVRWVNSFFAAMQRFSSGAVYVNDLEDEGALRVRAAYGAKYQRLSQLKRRYDPDNVFHNNQNIPPSMTEVSS